MVSENDVILERARLLAKSGAKNNLRGVALIILYDIAFPMNGQSFEYAKRSILTSYGRTSGIAVGQVFSEVGASFDKGVSAKTVEKVMGDGIKTAWAERAHARWDLYFPQHILRNKEPPSNLTFLITVNNFLEMFQDCCEEVEYAGK